MSDSAKHGLELKIKTNKSKSKNKRKAYSSEMALNWAGASTNFFRISLASVTTARKSPTPNPKLISRFQCENTNTLNRTEVTINPTDIYGVRNRMREGRESSAARRGVWGGKG